MLNCFSKFLIALFVTFGVFGITPQNSEAVVGMMAAGGSDTCMSSSYDSQTECLFLMFGVFFSAGTTAAIFADVSPRAGLLLGIVLLSQEPTGEFLRINSSAEIPGFSKEEIERYNQLVPKMNLRYRHLIKNGSVELPDNAHETFSLEDKARWMNDLRSQMTATDVLTEDDYEFFLSFLADFLATDSGEINE